MKIKNTFANERGTVLVTGLMFLLILTLIGSTSYFATTNELKTSRNYRIAKKVFYEADAGVEFAIAKLEGYLEAGTGLTLPTSTGSTVSLPDAMPTGFNFSLSPITAISSTKWSLISTGSDPKSAANASIEVLFYRTPVINYAAFGNSKVDARTMAAAYSYDSSSSDPCVNNPLDPCWSSSGEGDIGSNINVDLNTGVVIDGDVALGANSSGIPATATGAGSPGATIFYMPAIDADPMGINSGGAYDPTSYSAGNDNAMIVDPTGGYNSSTKTINLTGTLYLCGKPGGANYYFTNINVGASSTIKVDVDNSTGQCGGSIGPVNVFLDNKTGVKPLTMGNSANIQVTGKPIDFTLLSNATGILELKNSSGFQGFVYAPQAYVQLKEGTSYYGSIWADTVESKNGSTIYYDAALRSKWESGDIGLFAWRQVRN